MATGVLGLFKFGWAAHIEEFCRLGRLFMRPHREFRDIETDELRRDENEGVHSTFPSDRVKLRMEVDGTFHDIPGISGPIKYSRDRDENVNVFCMYALCRRNPQTLIDPKNCSFGDAYVLLKDGDEFLRRVHMASIPDGQKLRWSLVEYVDPATYLGHMGFFKKFDSFQYQSEFRIALIPGFGKNFCLDIGDLSDITIVGKLSDVNTHLKIE